MVKLVRNVEMRRIGCVATLLLAGALTGCSWEYPQFDPRAAQRSEREHASQVRPEPMRPLPTTLESSILPPRSAAGGGRASTVPTTPPATGPSIATMQQIRMPLQDIIHRAVAHSLDVRVAGYQPAIDASRAVEAEARFDPTAFSNVNFERRNNLQAFNTVTSAGNIDRENIVTSQTGVRKILESGGQIELRYQSVFTDVHQGQFSQVDPNPFYDNQVVLQLTQPLLQNFGNDVNRARITIARNNQRISLLDFKKQIEETTGEIEKNYWQLVQAERNVQISERLLAETLRTADILLKRLGQDVTRVQLSQANASVEQRRAVLIRAKSAVIDFSDQLKRLMQDPELPVTSAVLLLPADAPLEEPCRFELSDEIATAMQNRFELGQQQLRIDSANIASNVARNNELPQVNLVGQVGYQGLGDWFGKAVHEQFEGDNLNYQIGIQFEYPIGNRAARSVSRRARLQQQQAIDQYANLVDQISLDVKRALRDVDTSWNEMVARRQSRFAAADTLVAIQQREDGGEPLTPTFVNLKLQTQSDLAQAARDEVEAIANYNVAISRLEFSKGTLLKYNNVLMEEEQLQLAQQ